AALAPQAPRLGHRGLEGRAQLRIRAAYADRGACHAGDARKRGEEHELLPARALDVVDRLDVDAGFLACCDEALGARSDLQALHRARMAHDAGRADRGGDVGHARPRMPRADLARDDLRRFYAVLEREHLRVLAEERP